MARTKTTVVPARERKPHMYAGGNGPRSGRLTYIGASQYSMVQKSDGHAFRVAAGGEARRQRMDEVLAEIGYLPKR